MARLKEVLRQYRDLARNINGFSAGQAELVTGDNDEDNMEQVKVAIAPNDGHYKGGRFVFELDLNDGYPQTAPGIRCLSNVYHPNIDMVDGYSEGEICLNLLDEGFSSELTLEDYVQGLLFLFYNPNIDDPLSGAFSGSESEEVFHANVRRSMRGESIDDLSFDQVLPDYYVSDSEEEEEEEDKQEALEQTTSEDLQDDDQIMVKVAEVTRDETTGQHVSTTIFSNSCDDKESVLRTTSKLVPTNEMSSATNKWYNAGLLVAMGVTLLTSFGVMRLIRR